MDPSHSPRVRVAICGAGVGGLVLALILSRSPHITVDVYEAASQIKEIGAGIGMWPRTWKIMKKLGLDGELGKKAIIHPEGIPKVAFHFRRGDIPHGHTFQTLVTPGGLISFHRPAFQSVLLETLSHNDPHGERVRTHTGKRLVSYTDLQDPHCHPSCSKSGLELKFADGTTAVCDFLVGADGIKSNVRATMCRNRAEELREQQAHATSPAEFSALGQEAEQVADCAEAVWSGMFSYRATMQAETLQKRWKGHRVLETPHVYLGKDSQMTVYPMARGTLVNFAAFRARYEMENTRLDAGSPMVTNVSKEEFKKDFEGWEDEVKALIDCLETTSRWAVHTVKPLKSFISSRGNVVLLGDAAHAMMPFQGSGAGQAIEDAYILGTLLTYHPTTTPDLSHISRIYDTIRRPIAQHVASVSRDAGMLYTLNYPGLSFNAPSSSIHSNGNGLSNGDGRNGYEDAGKNGEVEGGEEEERLQEVYSRIRMNWEWAWETSVEGDLERAVGMLEGGGEV